MRIDLPRRRWKTADTPEGLEIVIPVRRQPFALLFLLVWLCGWAMGEFFAVRQLLIGDKGPIDLFLLAWLVMWTFGGAWAVYSWLLLAFGKEIIVVGSGVLSIKRDILGAGRRREYDLMHVADLRVSRQPPMGARAAGFGSPGGGVGAVAFDYGARTIRFGMVDDAEAEQIVSEMKARQSFGERAA